MIDIANSVEVLLTYGLEGLDAAFNELVKGMANQGVSGLGEVWRNIFAKEQSTQALLLKLQEEPDNQAIRSGLEAIVKQVLEDNPDLLAQTVEHQSNTVIQENNSVKTVYAKDGGIAIGINKGNVNR